MTRWLKSGVAAPVAALLVFGTLGTRPAAAQGPSAPTGTIVGKVLDPQGYPLGGANVAVVDGNEATSAVDGRYTLRNVPVGTVSLKVRMIGYQAKTVTGVPVTEGSATELDVALASSVVTLAEVTVSVAAERGSVAASTELQRNAVTLLNAISSEQISRSPDGDAAQVVQRMSGLTLQEGKFIFVRGLGERYTAAALNGVRLPSPEQERKVVPLDLFPAGFLQSVVTQKAFTPDQPGDVSGATVDLQTKEFPANTKVLISTSTNYNPSVTGKRIFAAPTTGREWLGFAGSSRSLPNDILAAGDLTGLTQNQVNGLIGQFRNVWAARTKSGTPGGGFSASIGGETGMLGHALGYLFSGTYGYSEEARLDETRGLAVGTGEEGTARPQNVYKGSAGKTSVLWGGIANLSTHLGTGRIALRNTYTRSADNEASVLSGENEEFGHEFQFTRLTFVERTVRSSQLSGEHLLGRRMRYDWNVTNSRVTRDEPDRSDIGYVIDDGTGEVTSWFGAPRFATRTFGALTESGWSYGGNYRLDLGGRRPFFVKVGGLYRTTDRDAATRAYDLSNRTLTEVQRTQDPSDIFTPDAAAAGAFLLQANANAGVYNARERVKAGYLQLESNLTDAVHVVAGVRVEDWQLDVDTRLVTGSIAEARPKSTDYMPAVAVNVLLGERSNLRFAASQTVSRPEYRELSPVPYFEQVGLMTTFGNPELKRARVQSVDARWEWFPSGGETFSLGVFAKRFLDPIEKVIVLQAGTQALSFVNAESGRNLGVEADLRKRLGGVLPNGEAWTLSGNLTLMRSRIRPGSEVLTNENRPMVGQSGYVVNGGLTYAPLGGRFSASVLYNVTGRRIAEAGASGLPDAYEEARNVLDASAEMALLPTLTLKLDARNLFDSPYTMTQGGVVRVHYRSGPSVGVKLSWQP